MRQRVLAIGFLLLGLWPALAAAAAAGVDLIFLIDQSGSMMGQGATRVSNDPNGKRFDILYTLEGRLAESAAAGMTNRISVIEFGGRNAASKAFRPQATLSRYEIPPLPPGDDPRASRRHIRDGLTRVGPKFRGDTDHADALRLATLEAQYFRDHPPAVAPGGQAGDRQQVVALITDGASYAEGVLEKTLKTEAETQVHKLEQASQALTFLVFGFNDASDYWNQGWGDFWDRLTTKDPVNRAGRAYRLLSDDQAVDRAVELVAAIIPPVAAASPAGERYVAPAYLRALDFTINFKRPGIPLSAIDIRDPNDQPVAVVAGAGGVASASAPYPQPGVWRFPASPDYTVIPIPRYETATLVEPVGPVGKDSAVRIRYRLSGRGPGGLFQPQPDLPPVQFQLTLVSPSGQRQTIPVQEDGAGHVVSQADFPLPETGTYALEFKGETLAVDGERHTVYQSAQAGGDTIAVSGMIPLTLRLEQPRPQPDGAAISLLNGAAATPLRLRFYNPKTNALLDPQAVLKSGVVLTVAAQPEGASAPPGAAAKAQLQATEQELTAVLPLDYGGVRWGDYFGGYATFRLQLGPDNFWRPDYHFLGIDGDARRYLLSPPLTARESWWSLWPALLLLLLLAGLWLAWNRFGQPWLLALRDERLGQNPKLVFKVIKDSNLNKTWPLKGTGAVTEPNRVVLNPETGDTWAIQNFKIKRVRAAGKEVAVRLSYQPRKPEKAKTIKVKLFTRDDSGQHSARHRVEGLEDEQEAAFVLFAGNKNLS